MRTPCLIFSIKFTKYFIAQTRKSVKIKAKTCEEEDVRKKKTRKKPLKSKEKSETETEVLSVDEAILFCQETIPFCQDQLTKDQLAKDKLPKDQLAKDKLAKNELTKDQLNKRKKDSEVSNAFFEKALSKCIGYRKKRVEVMQIHSRMAPWELHQSYV